jgi:tyrosine-protein kinase Etk/Wzc
MNTDVRIRPEPRQPRSLQLTEYEFDLRDLPGIILGAKWLIAAIAAAVLLLAVLYAVFATPIYQSNVLLQVNENNAAYQTGTLSAAAASLTRQSPPADTEIAIMRSRYVVGRAVDKLGLMIDAKPHYLPLIGRVMARNYDGVQPATPFLWFTDDAWGGEKIEVTRLNVPDRWLGKPLTLVAGAGASYTLYGPEGNKLLTGQVGKPAYANSPSNPSPSPRKGEGRGEGDQISLFISTLNARPGTHFTLTKHTHAAVVKRLQSKLSISETGVGTNIVNMSLDWPRPRQLARILDTLAATYIQQNVNNNAQQARESLKFLQTQLPQLKAKLGAAQSALSQYQTHHQALDVSADTRGLLDQMVNIQQQLSKLKLKETEMSGRFNAGYPGLHSVRAQIGRMQKIKAQLESRIKNIPQAQQTIFRLKRNVQVDSALYMSLLDQSQKLKIAQAGTVGDARIIDHALVPTAPVKPRKKLIAASGLLLGAMLGVLVVLLRRALSRGIDDPEAIERDFALPVAAIVPRSDELIKARRSAERRHQPCPILAQAAPGAPAIEVLRSLRTQIRLALRDAANNVIALGSPTAATGKSFIIVNLAQLLARSGKRVLLIDCDMRRGHLHRYFGADRAPGLSQVLSGEVALEAAIHHHPNGPDALFCGLMPGEPAELLTDKRFAETIAAVSEGYDLVLLDAPPILAVTDGAIIAEQAGINLVVLRAGHHAERDIKLMLRSFEQSHVTLQGAIFNDLNGAHRYHYEYAYR